MLALLVLLLNLPEHWHGLFALDVWAADQVAQGLTIALLAGLAWPRNRVAAFAAGLFGLSRATCVGLWPNASDSLGSVCDSQTSMPLTVAFLAAVLFAVGRTSRE